MIADITDAEVAELEAEFRRNGLPGSWVVEKDGEYFVTWLIPDLSAKRQPAQRVETRRVTNTQAHQLVEAGADWRGSPALGRELALSARRLR